MTDVSPEGVLLHGIPFTGEELRLLIGTAEARIISSAPEDDIAADCTDLSRALGALQLVSAVEQANPLEIENFTSKIATRALAHLTETRGNTPFRTDLAPLAKTPLHDAKKRADDAAKLAQKRDRISGRIETIKEKEQGYAPTSRQLRRFTYQVGEDRRDGAWLKQKIVDLNDNGSQNLIFNDTEAHFLAGLSILEPTHENIVNLPDFMSTLAELRSDLRALGESAPPRGLYSAVNTLAELYEDRTSGLYKSTDLKPLLKLAELLFKNQDESTGEFVDTIDLGPFAHCPELSIMPFQTKNVDRSTDRYSKVEIPKDIVTAENLLADFKVAKAESKTGKAIEQERITDFIDLLTRLVEEYGEENIKIFRTLRPKWDTLPWYVIQVTQSTGQPLVILENFIVDNASYYINEDDWLNIIKDQRKVAQQFGAHPRVHVPGSVGKPFGHKHPVGHREKLYNTIHEGHKG